GSYRNKEDDIEDHVRLVYTCKHRICRKHDGDGTTQSNPGDIQPPPEFHPKERQRKKHAHRPCHDDEEAGNKQADTKNGDNMRRKDQQTEGKKQDDLHEPCKTIEHLEYGVLMDQLLVPEVQRAEVYSEKAVAGNEFRSRERDVHEGDDEHRVKTLVIQSNPVDDEFAYPAKPIPTK